MFPKKGFYGGVHPHSNKKRTSDLAVKEALLPKKAIIPLLQHAGAICEPQVKVQDEVFVGTKIGVSEKFISSPIHSSISGKVTQIVDMPHPVIGKCLAIVIESDGQDKKEPSVNTERDYSSLSKEEIITIIKNSGLVGMGGAMFPTHVKLMPPTEKPIDSVILNGVECEPYITCDHVLMRQNPREILEALKIIIKVLGAKKAFIAIERNKPDVIKIMRENLGGFTFEADVEVVGLNVKYPQGAEKQLIKAILNREVPSGKLPLDVGVVVQNVHTAFSIFEAIARQKPLYERLVTFTGGALKQPSNMRVRIGTSLKDIVESLGGLSDDLSRVVFGGPMMGIAQSSLDMPIIKGTSSVLFLTKKEVFEGEHGPCIRCGRCIDVCPMKIMPANIALTVEVSKPEAAVEFFPLDCIECGACSFICPTKRPLVQFIKLAKLKAREML